MPPNASLWGAVAVGTVVVLQMLLLLRLRRTLQRQRVEEREALARAAESAVRANEKRTRALLKAMPDLMFVQNRDGTYLDYHAPQPNDLFVPAEYFLGRNMKDILPPSLAEQFLRCFEQAMAEGGPVSLEYALPMSGEMLYYEARIVRRDEDTLVSTVRNITERKRAEQAVFEEKERAEVTLQSIGDAVISTDTEGRVTFMNGVAERLTGWTLDAALSRPLAEVFHIVNETSRLRVDNPTEKVLRTGAVVGLANHTVLIGRDGSEWPIADSAAPIYDDDRHVLGVVLVFHDVTEERRAERELAEQREWFETTLGSIGDGVIATDIRGRVVFMNPVAEHLTGWRLADARGRDC